jgi:hypothetical protein
MKLAPLCVRIKGRTYPVHMVIVALFDRAWPRHKVDHRDLDKANNRLSRAYPVNAHTYYM